MGFEKITDDVLERSLRGIHIDEIGVTSLGSIRESREGRFLERHTTLDQNRTPPVLLAFLPLCVRLTA